MITAFKNITDTTNPHYTKPETLLGYIKDGRYREQIQGLRGVTDKNERNKLKANLPSVCWSGKFFERKNNALLQHSGLVCVDFDHIENLEVFKKRICKDQYTYIAFVSPSGDGLKVVIKIPANEKTHADSCRAITKYFGDETLDEFRDVARVCYVSYDPNAYINHEADLFNDLLTEGPKHQPKQVFYPEERITDTNDIYNRITIWLDKQDSYGDGNKHKYLVRLAAACLRFGISEIECSVRLYSDYSGRASKVSQKNIETLVASIYKNAANTANTAFFENGGDPVYTETKKKVTSEIFDIDFHQKDVIYIENVKQSMFEGFKTGRAKGLTTYYEEFDKHWTWRKKEVTFVGGIGNMGKTIMINNLCVLRAMNNDWKTAFFTPEQDPPDDFYNDLIHTYTGKSTEPHHSNQLTQEEYTKAMDFIGSHFYYIYPESESPTPEYINQCFEYMVKKHKVDIVVVDPFNQLDNDWKKHGRDDLYISEFLSKCKRFSQKHNIAYMIAGHPKGNLQKVAGNYEQPNVYDYAGGAMWNNKCDNILCYHRPLAITNPQSTECFFISQKIKKRKLTGIPGSAAMIFNIYTNRFEDEWGNSPFPDPNKENKQPVNPDAFIEPSGSIDMPPF